MNQTTKTVKTIRVSPREMTAYKEDMLDKMIGNAAQQVNHYADIILNWARSNKVDKTWTYIVNKDVYYIPEIVGVMPNLVNFETGAQQCSNAAFDPPSVEKMKFGEFNGDFPTAAEAKKCFSKTDRYCRKEKYITVKGTDHDGVTCKYRNNSFVCYNIYRDGKIEKYGEGSSSDYGWNIPIYRFNEENSASITLGQTILFWLQYDLRPEQFKTDKEFASAFGALQKCQDYLVTTDDRLVLNYAKVSEAIHSGKELSWMPKEASMILSAKKMAGSDELINKVKNNLLHADEHAVALDPYDEKILTDPNRGHWDLWGRDGSEGEDTFLIDVGEGFTARNPEADVSDGIVAIDFGTKSTVVVYETTDQQILPLQVGSGAYGNGLQVKNYENPTVLQFINLDSFLAAYTAKNGRPATSWNDITVSYNAFQNLKDAASDQHNTFLDDIKGWCSSAHKRLKLQDAQGKIFDISPYQDLIEGDVDPLEIYAYYLGRFINHMIRGELFVDYYLSFPVTYEPRLKECMTRSIARGLRKSLPEALLSNEKIMKKFKVRGIVSEPAAYAITALQEYNFTPVGDEQVYYAVFDFGGGTTDFDFGMFKESEAGDDRYDYVLTHFGENGDRTLGGENLLRLLAFEVFRANKGYLLHPDDNNENTSIGNHIPFSLAPDAKLFAGHERLLKNSREAQQNMRNLMEKLRPVWEDPESTNAQELISSGQIQLTLYRENGEKKTDANLKLKIGDNVVDLQAILKNRIEQGIKRFFTSLAEAFEKSAGQDSRIVALSEVKDIYVFLAGNSSKSQLVKEIFNEYIDGRSHLSSGSGSFGYGLNLIKSPSKECALELLENRMTKVEEEIDRYEKASSSTTVEYYRNEQRNLELMIQEVGKHDSVGRDVLEAIDWYNVVQQQNDCAARKLLKLGDTKSMPKFRILPPLGSPEAERIRKDYGIEDTRETMMRPTGKTGVAYGLLKCRDGGEIKVEAITPDEEQVPFQYYIGRRKKGKFCLVIDRNTKMQTWYKFINAGGAFDILYTDRPEAATDDAPMTIAKQKHIIIEEPDENAFVFLRPISSRRLEWIVAENEDALTSDNLPEPNPIDLE